MKTPKGPEPGWEGVQKEAGPTVLRLQQWATCLGTWPYLPHLAGVAGAANIADQWKEEGGSRQALKGPRCYLANDQQKYVVDPATYGMDFCGE